MNLDRIGYSLAIICVLTFVLAGMGVIASWLGAPTGQLALGILQISNFAFVGVMVMIFVKSKNA